MNRKFLFLLFFFLPAFSLSGCEKNNAPEEYKPQGIHVNKTSLTMKVGYRELLTASVVPAAAHQPALQWSSADESVATITDGWVEAVAAGETSVTVAYQDVGTVIPVRVEEVDPPKPSVKAVLYESALTTAAPELSVNGLGNYTADGLRITVKGNTVQLNKFYALAERMVQYRVVFASDTRAIFRSSQGDFNAYVDVPNQEISIATNPVTKKTVAFLQRDREYIVEVYHIYQQAKLRIVDILTGEEAEISATHDGQGGVGQGALQEGFSVGMQWDHYCFGLDGGSSLLVKQITVYSMKNRVKLLIYGDSVSQPEGYFPIKDFPLAWTQRIISRLDGDAVSSGRGGGTIHTVLEYIKNELPFIKAEYVMVTIGTNGGNTESNLDELVSYIRAQGCIPILNNVPSNESATQVEINSLIDRVRLRHHIKGCRFDLATSLAGDGKEVDRSTMYWENYTNGWGNIYHHPNEKGGQKMYDRTLIDIPEIYE
ncbi:MAG: Ig-like domain-containing protein [Bacteroidales bacterium]|jgi:acylphosphatase|nr:Ig-like domain-containing protein [Bacteroidales bacterium]